MKCLVFSSSLQWTCEPFWGSVLILRKQQQCCPRCSCTYVLWSNERVPNQTERHMQSSFLFALPKVSENRLVCTCTPTSWSGFMINCVFGGIVRQSLLDLAVMYSHIALLHLSRPKGRRQEGGTDLWQASDCHSVKQERTGWIRLRCLYALLKFIHPVRVVLSTCLSSWLCALSTSRGAFLS